MTIRNSFPTDTPTGLDVLDTRLALAGLVVRDANGAPRTGVFPGGADVLVTGTGSMAYAVAEFVAATSRTGTGVELLANEGTTLVPTAAAPSANARIDIVYVRSRFAGQGDAAAAAELGVVHGAAALSPVPPLLPAGALELARSRVPAGVTSTSATGVVITQTAPFTAGAGGTVPFRNRTDLDAWTTAAPRQRATLLSAAAGTSPDFVWNGTGWFPEALPGLVPVLPTSVSAQYGAATVSGATIRLTSANKVRLNGLFTSAYSHYLVKYDFAVVAPAHLVGARFVRNGAEDATARYSYLTLSATGTTPVAGAQNGVTGLYLYNQSSTDGTGKVEIYSPADASRSTRWLSDGYGTNNATQVVGQLGGQYIDPVSQDGLSLYHPTESGRLTGTLRVYAYTD